MNIGLIGCGNIGKFLLQSINDQHQLNGSKITAVYVRREEVANELRERYGIQVFVEIESFLQSDVDLVIEVATVEVATEYGLKVLQSGKSLLLSSIGAMVDPRFSKKAEELCREMNVQLHLPSGAIGGLDVLKAAKSTGGLEAVSLTTRKPPTALSGNVSADAETILFEGTAQEAIKKFPKNINVAIVLALAGLGVENTKVRIISDPAVLKNRHTIKATGTFGNLKVEVENDPMPNNPKTSYLAALSVLATMQNMKKEVQIG